MAPQLRALMFWCSPAMTMYLISACRGSRRPCRRNLRVSLSTDTHRRWQNTRRESGQAAIVLLAFFSVLLLTAAGLAVDVSNLWFHRQAAQAAADAACQAGALDLLDASAGGTPNSGF